MLGVASEQQGPHTSWFTISLHRSRATKGRLLLWGGWAILGSRGRASRASFVSIPGVSVSPDSVFRDCQFLQEQEGSQSKCLWWAGKEDLRRGLAGAQVALSLALPGQLCQTGGVSWTWSLGGMRGRGRDSGACDPSKSGLGLSAVSNWR